MPWLLPSMVYCWLISKYRDGRFFRTSFLCAGEVRFDDEGRPFPKEGGHGLGTASIAAYCEKYGASCIYHAEDDWFSVKIIQLSAH